MNKECVKKLVHYAVDKASPFALATDPKTDTYEDIKAFRLTQLAITAEGLGLMWGWINANVKPCKAKPVPASSAAKADTVEKVYKAIEETSKA